MFLQMMYTYAYILKVVSKNINLYEILFFSRKMGYLNITLLIMFFHKEFFNENYLS